MLDFCQVHVGQQIRILNRIAIRTGLILCLEFDLFSFLLCFKIISSVVCQKGMVYCFGRSEQTSFLKNLPLQFLYFFED